MQIANLEVGCVRRDCGAQYGVAGIFASDEALSDVIPSAEPNTYSLHTAQDMPPSLYSIACDAMPSMSNGLLLADMQASLLGMAARCMQAAQSDCLAGTLLQSTVDSILHKPLPRVGCIEEPGRCANSGRCTKGANAHEAFIMHLLMRFLHTEKEKR